MDKNLVSYNRYITTVITKLESQTPPDEAPVRELLSVHTARVREFQHERIVHLFVTLFFAALLICSFVGLILLELLSSGPSSMLCAFLLGALTMLLLITTLFYVYHYFKLENGTQRLYAQTDRLTKLYVTRLGLDAHDSSNAAK